MFGNRLNLGLSVRILLAYFLLVGLAGWWFLRSFMAELTPGMKQSQEEVLVELSSLLAERVSAELAAGRIESGEFAAEMERLAGRRFHAEIWSQLKQEPNLIVYITDRRGWVVYHSQGRDLGADYSRWNDVHRTLRGGYGARSSRSDPSDPRSSTMYVAAPVMAGGEIIGVLTLGKPSLAVQPFIEAAERHLREQGLWLLLGSFGIGLLLALWLTRSIRRLTRYAQAVRAGERVAPPQVSERELAALADAMSAMRAELEGKEYVEQYLHSLTHELKSPLTAIRGAAELLDEEMPAATRRRFLANIRNESERLRQIVERLLSLAALEKRQTLEQIEEIDTLALLQEVVESRQPTAAGRGVELRLEAESGLTVRGERFLLQQAIGNLLDNALDFSPQGGMIQVTARREGDRWKVSIRDQGPGIPDYALPRIFDRFYSQPRPDGRPKSTGLGLSFVREVAELHGGRIVVANEPGGGAEARLEIEWG